MKRIFIPIAFNLIISACKKDDQHGFGSHGSPWLQFAYLSTTDQSWVYDSINKIYSHEEAVSIVTASVSEVDVYYGRDNGALKMPVTIGDLIYTSTHDAGYVRINVGSANDSIPNNPGAQNFMVETMQW
jgi:hypothetical protein